MKNTKKNIPMALSDFPVGNYIIMLLMVIIFAMQFLGDPQQNYLGGLILKKNSFQEMSGYFWLHMGPVHIISNMILLAVYGRQTSIKIGPAKYILAYFVLGFAAAIPHLMLDARPVIGSSGAISGVMGLAIVLNWKKLSPLGPWIVLIWVVISIFAALATDTAAAHIAHIGGFLTGMILAVLLIAFNQADHSDTDYSLMRIINRRAKLT
jgi:membrane associated rhomboid family serine protease